mgnify:CR=1 FL=1
MPLLRLSVLDQSPISEGATPAEALRNTVDLARHADRLGYHRYWLAEHHGGVLVAGAAPEALIGPIAARTRRLRVGSGGVMLPYYSPFKVAETFAVLAGLFPGRVDLGIGRAPGTDPMTMQAVARDRTRPLPDDFPEQLRELLAYYGDGFPEGHPLGRLAQGMPRGDEAPQVWLLGSSEQSAYWAGELGLPYSFADFIRAEGERAAEVYRDEFRPGATAAPRVSVGLAVLAAETEEEAVRLAASWRVAFSLLRRGRPVPVPPPGKALRFLQREGKDPAEPPRSGRRIIGTPDRVREEVERVAAAYGAEEVVLLTITHDHEARRRSYELLAREFGLPAEGGAAGDEGAAPGQAPPAAG